MLFKQFTLPIVLLSFVLLNHRMCLSAEISNGSPELRMPPASQLERVTSGEPIHGDTSLDQLCHNLIEVQNPSVLATLLFYHQNCPHTEPFIQSLLLVRCKLAAEINTQEIRDILSLQPEELSLQLSQLSVSGAMRSEASSHWLSPLTIAMLRGNSDVFNAITDMRYIPRQSFRSVLLLANELANLGFAHPLARLLRNEPLIQTSMYGVPDILSLPFNQNTKSENKFVIDYWLKSMHPQLAQLPLSSKSLMQIAASLFNAYNDGREYTDAERIADAQNILHEINKRLIQRGNIQATVATVRSVINTPEFRDTCLHRKPQLVVGRKRNRPEEGMLP